MWAFDLIELNGDDLRRDPLAVRKATLVDVLARAAQGHPVQRA
jgi:ATP-dependent DNA ligase